MTPPGKIAVLLHTHMPYVAGFGTWPFGEEWLWEAIATSYLPIAGLLDDGAPLTLSLTPVLCDQLEAPGTLDRCRAFLRDVRPASHQLDIDAFTEIDHRAEASELQRAAGLYADALGELEAIGDNLLARLEPHAAWTSSATHAILPLLATGAGVRLQVGAGIAGHRRRFGERWRGGFWLPECAHGPWLDAFLEAAGVHAACVELTDVFGLGDGRHLMPLRSPAGPLLVPIDRVLIDLVWGAAGYPSRAAYRDYHHRTSRDHHPWANDGAVYDPARATEQVRVDAAEFAAACAARVAAGGLAVLAFDTELFGHWWHEGPEFLAAFVAAAEATGLEIAHLDDALEGVEAAPWPAGEQRVTTWGDPRTLHTWSGPRVADFAWRQREAELRVLGARAGLTEAAARELLALQASDWAFLETRELAGPYARERFEGHAAALAAALGPVPSTDPAVAHLCPDLALAPALEP